MHEEILRTIFGGVFLERKLETSSDIFEFTFAMFSLGSATLPADGMGAIPVQVACRLGAWYSSASSAG